MTKTLGSGGSGSVIQSHWSADPEPCQNVTLVCQKTGGWCQNNWGGGGGASVGSLLWISDVYLGSFTFTFSKVETGTGTITFQK